MTHTEPEHNDGPGAIVIIAYAVMFWLGCFTGIGVGWLIWG